MVTRIYVSNLIKQILTLYDHSNFLSFFPFFFPVSAKKEKNLDFINFHFVFSISSLFPSQIPPIPTPFPRVPTLSPRIPTLIPRIPIPDMPTLPISAGDSHFGNFDLSPAQFLDIQTKVLILFSYSFLFIYSLFKFDMYLTSNFTIKANQGRLSKLDICTCPWNSPHFESIQNVPETLWTTSESPVARPIHDLCPGGKQTNKVYIQIYEHRDMNKICNSK